MCGRRTARSTQRAFGRGLHVHPLGRGLIRDVYAYCSDLGERMGDAVQVKPGYAIKLALRLFLLDAATGNGSASKDNTCA